MKRPGPATPGDPGARADEGRSESRDFAERGFLVRRGLFTEGEVAETLEAIRGAAVLGPRSSALDEGGLTFRHNLVRRSPSLRAFVSQRRLVDLLRPIVGPDIWVRWDVAVRKEPGAPEFPWHQDNGYNHLKQPHAQLWVALTAITAETGLLWIQPGSHRRGVLRHRREGRYAVCRGRPEEAVAVEARPGDAILFSSLALHRTDPNLSRRPRWAYVVQYMSLDQIDPYVDPPYLVVARRGEPCQELLTAHPGMAAARNRLLYLFPLLLRRTRARERARRVVSMLRRARGAGGATE